MLAWITPEIRVAGEYAGRSMYAPGESGALTFALIFVFTLSGCGFSLSGDTSNVWCCAQVHHPHESHGRPGYMDAKMSYVCDDCVTDAWGEIKLQRQDARGHWVDVSKSFGARSAPSLSAGGKFVVMTDKSVRCISGKYRALGRGGATYQGVPNRLMEWTAGEAVKVSCK